MKDKIINGCANPNFDCSGVSCVNCPFDISNELPISDIKEYLENNKKIVKALEILIEKEG